MDWTIDRDDDTVTEWKRGDGHATVRIREKPNGSFAVRLDVMVQAETGDSYRYETAEDRDAVEKLARRWMADSS